jgi:putative nucleotidyltransferase with HDIG domain
VDDAERIRANVRASLPELALIGDAALREQVVVAWTIALAESGLSRIEELPPSGGWGAPSIRRGSQVEHLRAVATMALGLARGLREVFPEVEIDEDVLVAASLLHDVGKAYEISPANLERWQRDPSRAGLPAVRHPVYGVHVALLAGLPEEVVHVVGAHSVHREGAFVEPSLENVLVQYADYVQWKGLEVAGMLTGKMA